MTPLRQKMIDAMRVRGFSMRTHESYLSAVSELARYYGRSTEGLDVEELQAFFAHLAIERGLSGLRHAYATHQLEGGLPVHALQRLLGHHDLHSTLRYVHWVPETRAGQTRHGDLLGALEEVAR